MRFMLMSTPWHWHLTAQETNIFTYFKNPSRMNDSEQIWCSTLWASEATIAEVEVRFTVGLTSVNPRQSRENFVWLLFHHSCVCVRMVICVTVVEFVCYFSPSGKGFLSGHADGSIVRWFFEENGEAKVKNIILFIISYLSTVISCKLIWVLTA